MKKITIFLILFIVFFQLSFSQGVFKFRAHTVATSKFNVSLDKYDKWSEWSKSSILISYDTEKEVLKFYTEDKQIFYVTTNVVKENTKDVDGEDVTELYMDALDKNDKKVGLKIKSWDEGDVVQFYVYYSNLKYVYESKSIE